MDVLFESILAIKLSIINIKLLLFWGNCSKKVCSSNGIRKYSENGYIFVNNFIINLNTYNIRKYGI